MLTFSHTVPCRYRSTERQIGGKVTEVFIDDGCPLMDAFYNNPKEKREGAIVYTLKIGQ